MKSLSVMVVDDSSVMRRVISQALESRLGNEFELDVIEASDAKIAVDTLVTTIVDVVLMDWNMPNMTGLEGVQAIRKLGIDTPIVMCTTEGESAQVITAIRAGANNYVLKPFNAENLCEKVRQVLPLSV